MTATVYLPKTTSGQVRRRARLAWLQLLALDGDLGRAEPKRLRYRLLHTAADSCADNAAARCANRPDGSWPTQITAAFNRIAAISAAG